MQVQLGWVLPTNQGEPSVCKRQTAVISIVLFLEDEEGWGGGGKAKCAASEKERPREGWEQRHGRDRRGQRRRLEGPAALPVELPTAALCTSLVLCTKRKRKRTTELDHI